MRTRLPRIVLEPLQYVGCGCCHGNLRLGGSLGSDRDKVLGGIHVGYEHSYALRKGWKLFWQAKCDLMIKGEDLFRTGIVIGVKIPTK